MTTPEPDYDDTTPSPGPTYKYDDVGHWYTEWFGHVIDDRYDREHKWCRQWWRHDAVVVRFDALWRAWETAVATTDDGAAMSAWWVHHADPHWRAITAPTGPLHLCRPDQHVDGPAPDTIAPPPGWFDAP